MAITAGTLAQIAGERTDLDVEAVAHLERLAASWGVIADLCFSDLLLLTPVRDADGQFVVLAHVRATTGQTLYPEDQVGRVVAATERPHVAASWASGEMKEGDSTFADGTRVKVDAVPVRSRGGVVAILVKDSLPSSGRRPSPLERTYLETANALIRMVATGAFPFRAPGAAEVQEVQRVGDGTVRLDNKGRITYASPNAVSAFHRLGIVPTEGMTLGEVGLGDSAVKQAFTMLAPVTEEIERRDIVVDIGVIPLIEGRSQVLGALLLLRDVTELRSKERQLLSREAIIREIHHRVKNNLQTIAGLLRLQGRRSSHHEVRVALEESVRRIRSIALVHETLSRDTSEVLPFRSVVRPLVSMVEEGLVGPDSRVAFIVEGDPGEVPGRIATPLAVVMTELLQNAVEHGLRRNGDGDVEGSVVIRMARDGDRLQVEVHDDGIGLPDGFDAERSTGLGLQIVRTLVRSELEGRLDLSTNGGTSARLDIPVPEADH